MSDAATIECPFCASTLKAHATVCPNCNAVRAAGVDAKGNIVGNGYVKFIRVVLGLWALATLIVFATAPGTNDIGMYFMGFFLAGMGLLILLFNWRLVFSNGKEERWYRKD